MSEFHASRTLVKSPPELWAECSDAAALSRHLEGFGDIRITRLDPETAVAWEGERARGTVRIEPAGWGTKVILTAERLLEAVSDDFDPSADALGASIHPGPLEPPAKPQPEAEFAQEPPPSRRRFARLRAFLRRSERPELEPEDRDPPELDDRNPPEPDDRVAPTDPAGATLAAPESPPGPEPPPQYGPALEPEPRPEPVADQAAGALTAALDSLGQAHHRPYSRA